MLQLVERCIHAVTTMPKCCTKHFLMLLASNIYFNTAVSLLGCCINAVLRYNNAVHIPNYKGSKCCHVAVRTLHTCCIIHGQTPTIEFIFCNAAYSLFKSCYNAVADCSSFKMKCYTHDKVMDWIDQYLSDEAHNEKLILGDADVEEKRSNRDKLLGKGQKEKEKPAKKPDKKKKRIEQPKGIVWFCLQRHKFSNISN